MDLSRSLQLAQRTINVQCQQHSQKIISLNIGQDVPQENRIICEGCAFKDKNCITTKSLQDVERLLDFKYKEEESQIERSISEFMILISCINDCIQSLENKVLNLLKDLKNKIQQLNSIYQQHHKKQVESFPFHSLISKLIKNREPLKNQQLEQIGELLSQPQTEIPTNPHVLEKKVIQDKIVNLCLIIQKLNITFGLEQYKLQQILEQLQVLHPVQNYCDMLARWMNPVELAGHKTNIRSVAISQDNILVASGDYNGQIFIWKIREKQFVKKFQGDLGKRIQCLVFSKQLNYLAASQYQYASPSDILIFKLDQPNQEPLIKLKGHLSTVQRIQFTDNYLLSGGDDRNLKIWDLNQGQVINQKTLLSGINGLSISPNKQKVLCGCGNGKAYLFNQLCQVELNNWQTEENYISCTSFTADSKRIVLGHKKKITLWEVASQKKVREFVTNSEMWSVIAHFSEPMLFTSDGKLKIWNLESGELLSQLDVPGGYDQEFDKQVAITTDLKYMVTGGKNQMIKIYERQG